MKGDIKMTLRELANNIVIDADMVRVCAYYDDENDTVLCFEVYGCDDLGDFIAHPKHERFADSYVPGCEKYFDSRVNYISAIPENGNAIYIELFCESEDDNNET